MDTATCAPGVAAPGANASALEIGPIERDGRSLGRREATSRPVKRRSAWHGAAKSKPSKPRKSKRGTAVYAGAPFYRSTLGPIPAPKGTTIRQPGQFAAALASPRPFDGPIADPERQSAWRRVLAECGGDQARADVVLAARLRAAKAPRREAAPVERSKDWFVRHPGPDPQLVKWLHATRVEFAASFSKSRNAPCEQCGRPVVLVRSRKRVWCSEQCSRAWHNAKRARAQHPAKACRECGTTFQPIRADSIYCSPACRQSAYRHRGATVVSHIRYTEARAWVRPAVWLPLSATRRMSPLGFAA